MQNRPWSYYGAVIDKYLRRSTHYAIRTPTEDISVDRVTNWCEHMRARQLFVSPLGQAMGLPNAPKEVSCSEVGGSYQGMACKGAAELFISPQCVGCPLHKLKDPDNIGQEIVDAAQAEASEEEANANGDCIGKVVVGRGREGGRRPYCHQSDCGQREKR
jgi:hypothetical protein